MLDQILDVTIDYDRGPASFVTPCFRTFTSSLLLLPNFQIGEYFGTKLCSTFLLRWKTMITYMNSDFMSSCLKYSLLYFLELHRHIPHVLWIQRSRMKSLFVTSQRPLFSLEKPYKAPPPKHLDLPPPIFSSNMDDFSFFGNFCKPSNLLHA